MLSALTLFSGLRRRISATTLSPLRRRHLHAPPQLNYPLTHPIYTIWASNTSLGKTLVSAGLSISFLISSSSSSPKKFLYLKPIQTGFPSDSDSRFVFEKFSQFFLRTRPAFSAFASNHVLKSSVSASQSLIGRGDGSGNGDGSGMVDLGYYEGRKLEGGDGRGEAVAELICKTMYGWKEAVSPHLAAEREEALVEDNEVLEMLSRCFRVESGCEGSNDDEVDVMCIVETAGGVASPGPSGSLQCDLFRPFRMPAVLIGDGKLGGISGTISAYETLKLRGYDIVAVVLEEHGLVNEISLMNYLQGRGIPVLVLPPIPQDMSNDLMEWFHESQPVFHHLKEILISAYLERIKRLHELPKRAHDILWWPFTQHKLVPAGKVTVIDSRCGESFSVHKATKHNSIVQQFDACASWWTQGPDSTFQIELARSMGYATARYGHVMFPENVYEPALECAELLLEGVGKGWASRVYFSDNGSTAVEIALKMAFRKFLVDHEESLNFHTNSEANIDLKVLALKGSYHGDTLGAMEAQAPSPYTGFYQQPWYKGRGLFLDPPTVSMSNGIWEVHSGIIEADSMGRHHTLFNSRDEVFEKRRDNSDLAAIYSSYISQKLLTQGACVGPAFIGALIIEPVVQGAGGMVMIDPLFQRTLVKECQIRKIPVIFDEVFTGFWRLGVQSAAELLHCQPDISCFAKLMTGGIIPLAATLASEAVFEAFAGDSKLKALLHGHSYSAHAMGCTAAVESIKWFKDLGTNSNLKHEMRLTELWDAELVHQISCLPSIQRVVHLGTLCAMELQAEGNNSGYASLYAASLLEKLREDGIYMRPLGNVIYLMCGPLTCPITCKRILEKVYRRLEDFSQMNSAAV